MRAWSMRNISHLKADLMREGVKILRQRARDAAQGTWHEEVRPCAGRPLGEFGAGLYRQRVLCVTESHCVSMTSSCELCYSQHFVMRQGPYSAKVLDCGCTYSISGDTPSISASMFPLVKSSAVIMMLYPPFLWYHGSSDRKNGLHCSRTYLNSVRRSHFGCAL